MSTKVLRRKCARCVGESTRLKKAGEGPRRFKAGRRWSPRGQGEAAVMSVLMSREDSEFTLMRWAAIRGWRAWGARLLITFQQHPSG